MTTSPGTAPMIMLNNVEVTFGKPGRTEAIRALAGVSFMINSGETLGLVGESGSGKSTAGAVALGLRRPDAGTVQFAGRPLARSLRKRAGRVQAVLQHPQWALDPQLTVLDSVLEPLLVLHRRSAALVERALIMLDRVGLPAGFAGRRPDQLSGGQQQRVSIARALVTEPEFVVLDEAVSALDVSVQAQVLNLIKELQAERGFAALFISHDLAAVRYLADRIAVLQAGEIVETGPTAAFYRTPSHPYSQRLFEELRS